MIDNFLFGDSDVDLGDDQSLVEEGIVDSTGVLELVNFLETTFGIEVADDDLVPENLDTLDNLVAFVRAKKG